MKLIKLPATIIGVMAVNVYLLTSFVAFDPPWTRRLSASGHTLSADQSTDQCKYGASIISTKDPDSAQAQAQLLSLRQRPFSPSYPWTPFPAHESFVGR